MKKTYLVPEVLFEAIVEDNELLAGSPLTQIGGGGDDVTTPPSGDLGEVGEGDGGDSDAKKGGFFFDFEL
ncbi:MAG: hypothetical protein KBT34_12835 [Prevotella sp.]|nr:hypothetical protein [Candidatus Prevotella equi]